MPMLKGIKMQAFSHCSHNSELIPSLYFCPSWYHWHNNRWPVFLFEGCYGQPQRRTVALPLVSASHAHVGPHNSELILFICFCPFYHWHNNWWHVFFFEGCYGQLRKLDRRAPIDAFMGTVAFFFSFFLIIVHTGIHETSFSSMCRWKSIPFKMKHRFQDENLYFVYFVGHS